MIITSSLSGLLNCQVSHYDGNCPSKPLHNLLHPELPFESAYFLGGFFHQFGVGATNHGTLLYGLLALGKGSLQRLIGDLHIHSIYRVGQAIGAAPVQLSEILQDAAEPIGRDCPGTLR